MIVRKINRKGLFATLGAVAYLLAIVVTTQVAGVAASIIWYFSLGIGCVMGFFSLGHKIDATKLTFLIIIIVSGVANKYIVGNSNIREVALLVSFWFLSFVFLSDYILVEGLKLVVYINIVVVFLSYVLKGINVSIYNGSSNNFVSVYLLYPAVIYYSVLERQNRKTDIYTAIVIWILSLFAQSRGGIISTSIFLVGILISVYIKGKKDKRILYGIMVVLAIMVLLLNAERIVYLLNSSVITEFFRKNGIKTSRTYIWEDYFAKATGNIQNFLLGVRLESTIAGMEFFGNPHNSYINIHLYNGIFALGIIIFQIVRNAVRGFHSRRYVYVTCLIAIAFRAFTDNVFWPSYGTGIMFAMIFFLTPQKDILGKRKKALYS